MLAKIAAQPFSPVFDLLEAPHSLEHQSKCGRQPEDPDTCGPHASGCGIAWTENSTVRIERRGAEDRWDASFTRLIRGLKPTSVIAHNRLASPGLRLDVSCSHPFRTELQGEPVAFCHNGGILNLMAEAQHRGLSDSELFLETLVSKLPSLTHEAIKAVLVELASSWRYTALNAMLLTPTQLHLWRCYDENPKKRQRYEKYYTLYSLKGTDSVTVASEPVDSRPDWVPLPNRTLMSIEGNGKEPKPVLSRF